MKQSNKNIILITVFLALGYVAYQLSFTRTLEVKEQLEDLKFKIKHTRNFTDTKNQELRMAYLDSMISANRNIGSSLQNSLLKVLNKNSEELAYNIIAFKEPHRFTPEKSYNTTNSFEFSLEGNYKSLERILYILEKDYRFGSFAHLTFRKEKNYRLNKFFLQGHFLIQNFN